MHNHYISAVIVPQGAEYKSVCRGLRHIADPTLSVMPIPVGVLPLTRYLEKLQKNKHFSNYQSSNVLLMGLCGSLTPHYNVGDIVLYQSCVYQSPVDSQLLEKKTDPNLTNLLYDKLQGKASLVTALTSDHIIDSALEKQHLGQLYNTKVVDMEGFAALNILSQAGIAVAMVRVISDDAHQNMPNISSAISPDGTLLPLPLAIGMMRQPIAATRLIRGSLNGLRVLENVTRLLFAE